MLIYDTETAQTVKDQGCIMAAVKTVRSKKSSRTHIKRSLYFTFGPLRSLDTL